MCCMRNNDGVNEYYERVVAVCHVGEGLHR